MDHRQDAENAKRAKFYLEPGAKLDRLTHQVIGAAIEVHRALGPGFRESVYDAAICIELKLRAIPFERQLAIPVEYRGQLIGECVLDLLVAGQLVVELKAVESLAPIHTAQVVSYLKAGRYRLGLLLNFNVPVLKQGIRRVVVTN